MNAEPVRRHELLAALRFIALMELGGAALLLLVSLGPSLLLLLLAWSIAGAMAIGFVGIVILLSKLVDIV